MRRSQLVMERRALCERAAAGSRAQARVLLLRRGASRLVVVAACCLHKCYCWCSRGAGGRRRDAARYRCVQTYAETFFRVLLRSGVPVRRRNATALDGNARPRLPCRKPGNSSPASEIDVLWRNAGFSGAFCGSGLGVVLFDLKTRRTALAGVIGSHHASQEPCGFSNNCRAQHLLRLGSQQANGLHIYG